MQKRTLLFVHGTGVRNETCETTIEQIRSKVREFEVPCRVEALLWGDVLGVDFPGMSLPEPIQRTEFEENQALRWEYLRVDPLFDLKLWCTPGIRQDTVGDYTGAELWDDHISRYTPSLELSVLLAANNLENLFSAAWGKVTDSSLPERAFRTAGVEHATVARVFAEAVTAQLMFDGGIASPPTALPNPLANKIVERLLFDWGQMGRAVKDILLRMFGKATAQVIRPMRSNASRIVAPAIGDILNYLNAPNGADLRNLIRKKIELIEGEVFLLSHSLGGIACFETMAEARPEKVAGLITAGSQAPLLYEFDALSTLRLGCPLPKTFPPWLNFYDENDLLSYRANLVFDCKADWQLDSMLPPFEAHSSYWKQDITWHTIREFVSVHG